MQDTPKVQGNQVCSTDVKRGTWIQGRCEGELADAAKVQ